MLIQILQTAFTRDLNRLKGEMELYKDEKNIWLLDKGIANTAGNLCLHLVGNLNAYIGAQFGKTGYVRNRELEFSQKDLSRTVLIGMIEETIPVVNQALAALTEEDLRAEYPMVIMDQKLQTGFFLTHLATHLSYHLGQINYHRRLLDI